MESEIHNEHETLKDQVKDIEQQAEQCNPYQHSFKSKGFLLCCSLAFLSSIVVVLSCFVWFLSQSSDHVTESFPGSVFGGREKRRSSSSKQSPSNNNGYGKLGIVLCAKVTSETPYLLEWIEFHRLQGVDKFVLYHDTIPSDPKTVTSSLELEALVTFYRDVERRRRQEEQGSACEEATRNGASNCQPGRAVEDVVELQSAAVLIDDLWTDLKELNHQTWISHRFHQKVLLSDCLNRYKTEAEYIMHIDVDEFVYSPKYDTIWDFLESRKNQLYLFGKEIVGYHIRMTNFGSSGRLWDFHNFYSPDTTAGTVTAYYDQRDSSLFQFLQRLNESSVSSPLELAEQLDEFRMSRLKDQSILATTDVNEFSELIHQRLLHDFPSNGSGTPFLDALVIPALHASESRDSPLKGLAKHIDAVLSQILKARERQHLLNSSSTVASLGSVERANLYQYYAQNSALFYPLLIEEQTRRGPYANLDGKGIEKRIAAELFPVCKIPDSDRKQFLIKKEGFNAYSPVLSLALTQFSLMCEGKVKGITEAGKSIYITSSIRSSPDIRSSGQLKGCHYPSVHGCGHQIHGGYMHKVDITRDLRLDHHQFRSYQKRSFSLPTFRGDGPLGYSTKLNYTVQQEYLSSIVDTGKLRFVPQLRERLAQLHVVPKMPDYSLNTKMNDGEVTEMFIDRRNVTKKCSAIELLAEHQIMCPSDYPYVGYCYLRYDSRFSRYQPYSWCSDLPRNPKENPWVRIFNFKNVDRNKTLTIEETTDKHTVLCPGYGEIKCCDYDSTLQMYGSSQSSMNPKLPPPSSGM